MTAMDPFLKLSINPTLDRLITESYESYMQRLTVLKAVAQWDEIACRERNDISGGADARTRVRLILAATKKAALDECSDDDDSEDELGNDEDFEDDLVFYG